MLRLLVRHIVRLILRHKRITALVLVLVIGALAFMFLTQRTMQPAQQSVNTLRLSYEDIEVGYTTHEDLLGRYGVFEYEYVDGDYVVYAYPSKSSRYAPDKFYLKNDVVELKEMYFNPLQRKVKLDTLKNLHGEPDTVLYTQNSLATVNQVDLYSQKGIALFSIDGNITRIQHFRSTTPEGYRLTWGENLGDTKPTPQKMVPHIAE